jgi:hypothetical protein
MGVKQNFHVLRLTGKMRVNGENWHCVCLVKGLMLRQLILGEGGLNQPCGLHHALEANFGSLSILLYVIRKVFDRSIIDAQLAQAGVRLAWLLMGR